MKNMIVVFLLYMPIFFWGNCVFAQDNQAQSTPLLGDAEDGAAKPDAALPELTPIRYKTYPITFSRILAYARLSQVSYSTDVEEIKNMMGVDAKILNKGELARLKLQVIIGKGPEKRGQTIAIRGTENRTNVFSDLEFMKAQSRSLNIKLHKGFRQAAGAIYAAVEPELKLNKPVYITGHSLGGAIAVILDAYLRNAGFDVSREVTFGQPRVSNAFGASVLGLDAFDFRVLRVVHHADAVTIVPKLTYVHFAPELVIQDSGVYCVWPGRNNDKIVGKASDHAIASYVALLEKIVGKQAQEKPKKLFGLFPKKRARVGKWWGCSDQKMTNQ